MSSVNSISLFNASKASMSYETPEQIAEDARHTSNMLKRLINGLLQTSPTTTTTTTINNMIGNTNQTSFPLNEPIIIRNIVRVLGLLSSWISKTKNDISITSYEIIDMRDQEGETNAILNKSFYYIVTAIQHPSALYHASNALRSLCQHCGAKLATKNHLDVLLSMWKSLCVTDKSFLNHESCDDLQGLVGICRYNFIHFYAFVHFYHTYSQLT